MLDIWVCNEFNVELVFDSYVGKLEIQDDGVELYVDDLIPPELIIDTELIEVELFIQFVFRVLIVKKRGHNILK